MYLATLAQKARNWMLLLLSFVLDSVHVGCRNPIHLCVAVLTAIAC